MKNLFYSFLLFLILGQVCLFADSPCKDLSKDKCEANSDCTWVSGYKRKDGTTVDPYCRAKPGKGNNTEDKEAKKEKKKKEKDLDTEDKETKKEKKKKEKDLDTEDKETKKEKKKKEKDLDKKDKETKKEKKKKEQ